MLRVSVASTGREPPDHRDQKASDQENTHDDRGVDVVQPHHRRSPLSRPHQCGCSAPTASKMVKEGRRGAWSGTPPPASASEDAKERGPQLPTVSGTPEFSANIG